MAGSRRAWILGGAVAIAFAAATAFFLRPDRFDEVSRAWMESRALGIARVLAGASQAAVDFEDPVAAERALESVKATPGVAYAALSDAGGRLLARWGDAPLEAPPDGAGVAWDVGLLRVSVPVAGRGGSQGTLRLGFFLDELDARVRRTRVLVLWLSASTLLLGAAFARAVGLARRVKERTGELARTHEALEKLRRAQEQLVVADRRVSLGRLAAGVGHEINNPLSFVTANVTSVRGELADLRARLAAAAVPAGELQRTLADAEEALADAAHGAERVRRIVRQLKTFSRGGDDEAVVPLRLRDALDIALEMAHHEVKHRARLERLEHAVPVVRASPVRLAQVFLNLLVNAAQAIPEGDAEGNVVRVTIGIDDADRAFLSVKDSGTGIAPEVLPRLFEPFFTTKPAGAGTGLGLSISRGIVRELGGEIRVESAPGAGSTFTVTLPRAHAEVPEEVQHAPPPPPSRCEHLLVVDDEPLVATSLARVLSRWHRVEVATSGRDAIARVAGGRRYDHILCDLAMPDAGGIDVHEELARIAPDQARRLVLMTGGAFTERTRAFLERWPGAWIEKPIDFEKLRRILDAPPQA